MIRSKQGEQTGGQHGHRCSVGGKCIIQTRASNAADGKSKRNLGNFSKLKSISLNNKLDTGNERKGLIRANSYS